EDGIRDDLVTGVQTCALPISKRREKMIAFGYYGGKFSHLDFILPLLPTQYPHFCEPFGGSAAVLINRTPAPVETYNDLDSEVARSEERRVGEVGGGGWARE